MWGRKFDFVTAKVGDNLCWNVYVAFFHPYTVSEINQPILKLGIK